MKVTARRSGTARYAAPAHTGTRREAEVAGSVSELPGYRRAVRCLLDAARLVCGAEMDQLLEQVADGHAGDWDIHQRGCRYCQATLGELTAMWAPVVELATAPVTGSATVSTVVKSWIRQLGQETWCSVETTSRGLIRVAARVVTALARDSARMVPGVQVVLSRSACTATTVLTGHAASGPGGIVVDLIVVISNARPAPQVVREVQRRVAASLRTGLGLHTVTVNVTADNLYSLPCHGHGVR